MRNILTVVKDSFKLSIRLLLFRERGGTLKFIIGSVYSIIIIFSVAAALQNLLLAILLMTVGILSTFILMIVVNVLFELPKKFLYYDILKICSRINGIFTPNFYNYDGYLTDMQISNFHQRVQRDRVPNKLMLELWKYKLTECKEKTTIVLPILAALIILIVQFPIDIQYLINNILNKELVNNWNLKYFDWFLKIIPIIYSFCVYHSSICTINDCIAKIEFLKECPFD